VNLTVNFPFEHRTWNHIKYFKYTNAFLKLRYTMSTAFPLFYNLFCQETELG